MAKAAQLDLVHKAICSGVFGYIQWKDSAARLVRDDPEMLGLTPEAIRFLLRQLRHDCSGRRSESTDQRRLPPRSRAAHTRTAARTAHGPRPDATSSRRFFGNRRLHTFAMGNRCANPAAFT